MVRRGSALLSSALPTFRGRDPNKGVAAHDQVSCPRFGSVRAKAQFGSEAGEVSGELIDEFAAGDPASRALGDECVDCGVDPVGRSTRSRCANSSPVVADDQIGAVRERGGGDVTVLAVHGRHCCGGDVALVVGVM